MVVPNGFFFSPPCPTMDLGHYTYVYCIRTYCNDRAKMITTYVERENKYKTNDESIHLNKSVRRIEILFPGVYVL